MVIGICGKSGSGKSTLAKQIMELSNNRVVHLDIDRVGHNALKYKEAQEELVKTFGIDVLNDNKVDRKKLGDIVFNSRCEMDKLTLITWKYMQLEIDKFLIDNKDNIVILDWILLPKTEYFDKCDIKILLDIPYKIRKMRAIERDNITGDAFDLREKASIDYDEKNFDYVINSLDDEKIRKLVLV